MFEVMMEKKASDMQLKILTNRIDRLDSAEKNAKRKLKLAHKRAVQIQSIKNSKYNDYQKLAELKEQEQKRIMDKRYVLF